MERPATSVMAPRNRRASVVDLATGVMSSSETHKNLFEYKGGNFELLAMKGEAYVLIFPVYRHEDFRVQFQS